MNGSNIPKSTNPPDAHPKRVTLKTISEVTGLSLSTVSLSLRGGTTLKKATRQKVEEAALALGYVPDRAGVRLRTGKTNVITLVLDGANDSIDFARRMIRGIGSAISGTAYHLNVIPEFGSKDSWDSVSYILNNRMADGVIITHTSPRDPRVQLLTDANFPFVSHGRTEFFTPHAFHDFNSQTFASLSVERFAAKGCKKPLLMIGDDRTNNYQNLVTSFLGACTRFGLEGTVTDNFAGAPPDPAEARQFGFQLSQSPDRPDAILCDSEMRTISLIGGLQDGGVIIGKDIELLYKQTSDILPTLYPNIDSMGEDVFAAGQELTRLLVRRIEGEPPEKLQSLSEPSLHWRS